MLGLFGSIRIFFRGWSGTVLGHDEFDVDSLDWNNYGTSLLDWEGMLQLLPSLLYWVWRDVVHLNPQFIWIHMHVSANPPFKTIEKQEFWFKLFYESKYETRNLFYGKDIRNRMEVGRASKRMHQTHAPPVDSIVDQCLIALCWSIGREYCCLSADSFDHDVGSVRSDGRRRKMCFRYLMLGICYCACEGTKVPTYVFLRCEAPKKSI